MNTKILNQLQGFANYFGVVRQVGHTTAMLEGAKNISSIIITHNNEAAKRISENISKNNKYHLVKRPAGEKIIAISITDDLNKLRGMDMPIVFDNAALYTLFSDAAAEMDRLVIENHRLSKKIERAREILE